MSKNTSSPREIRTYKYRIYPNRQQEAGLIATLNICRVLYNTALTQRKYAYRQQKIQIRKLEQLNELPALKEAFPELKKVHSQVLQEVLQRVDRTYQAFFRRIRQGIKPGYPRFKGVNRYNSFTFPQSGFSISENRKGNQQLILSKIGSIKIRLHREIPGNIKTCTIKKADNQWYVCFTVETKSTIKPKTGKIVGIDVGVRSFAALSDGTIIPNPRHLKKSETLLKHKQRSLSRKKKGSNSWQKQRLQVGKLHRKIANQRHDFLHKESRALVNNHDIIVFEDLDIANMVQGHYGAKHIYDAAWGTFIRYTSYKAESAGKTVTLVDPWGTSETCCKCGEFVPKKLSTRTHKCPCCGLVLDRDVNAAINILRLGTSPGGATAVAGL